MKCDIIIWQVTLRHHIPKSAYLTHQNFDKPSPNRNFHLLYTWKILAKNLEYIPGIRICHMYIEQIEVILSIEKRQRKLFSRQGLQYNVTGTFNIFVFIKIRIDPSIWSGQLKWTVSLVCKSRNLICPSIKTLGSLHFTESKP